MTTTATIISNLQAEVEQLRIALSAMVEQRDELLAICERVVENGIGFSDVKAMKEAIASAKGGAA